jgi:LruC domain-containing protein
MKSHLFNFLKIATLSILLYSCSNPEFNNVDPNNSTVLTNKTFDFSTYRQVKISINDVENYTKYDIYAYAAEPYFAGDQTFMNQSNEIVTEPIYKNDVLNKLIFSGVPVNGSLVQTINVPKYCNKLYIRRNSNLNYSSSIVPIVNGEANFDFVAINGNNRTTSTEIVNDYLYCVNSAAELFQVNPLNGVMTFLSDMPMGSVTCAIDQANKYVYSIGNSSPYPLMRYSIVNDTWTTVKNLATTGPRLDFNTTDGLLYFSTGNKLYTINPTTGIMSAEKTITGLHNTHGGDLAFASDGTLFLCTFSGLYRLQLNGSVYESTRISGDNLPFQPTSMTFDSNGDLWLANNASSSDLIIMDTVTGGWQYVYGVSANNNTNFNRTINDLSTFRVYTTVDTVVDSDGDGIPDQDDAFPQDADIAFEMFTPSKFGTGTIAFEDLWPSYGDYDFNDVALNYKTIVMLNAQNLAVQMDIICHVKANGAGFTNGIGIEIGNLSPSQIQSVTGTVLTENYITVNPNGTEANQDHAVIILTDKANNLTTERTIRIKFTQPISTTNLGIAPFNPFIIVNKQRDREIHLPYAQPTSLGDNFFPFTEGPNRDSNGNYISDEGMPWAISFIHDFKVPKEKVNIAQAYNFFILWANSGGANYQDWYKDNPGNRNNDKIQN